MTNYNIKKNEKVIKYSVSRSIALAVICNTLLSKDFIFFCSIELFLEKVL